MARLLMSVWEDAVCQFYVEGFRQHHEIEIASSEQGLDLFEFLGSQGRAEQRDIIMEVFLNDNDLGWMNEPENRISVPENVLEAYDFYTEHGHEQVRVAKIHVQEQDTYAVRVKTDGDGGWLEVFDMQGQRLGTALTFLDVLSWEDQAGIREKFKNRGSVFPDWQRMGQLSVCYPP
jgi:hypothetical protein